MKSLLTNNQDRAPAKELSDLLLVPTSIIRFTRGKLNEGNFRPDYPQGIAPSLEKHEKAHAYIAASAIEVARLFVYYKLAQEVYKLF